MRYKITNGNGDLLAGEVEVNDEGTTIKRASGDFAHLAGERVTKLEKLLKAFVDYAQHEPKQKRIIAHCFGRKSLWERGLLYEAPAPSRNDNTPQLKKGAR